jgi:hypothetical protein
MESRINMNPNRKAEGFKSQYSRKSCPHLYLPNAGGLRRVLRILTTVPASKVKVSDSLDQVATHRVYSTFRGE